MEAETSSHHHQQQQQQQEELQSDGEVDVLVVGGGPVGLMTACELRLQGLRVVVCERRETRTPQSRALTIHGRTLEVLALRGVAQRFTALGRPIPAGHYGALDTRLDFSVFDSTFPYTLFLPQTTTEALLEEWAIELGVIIQRGQCVIEIEQDAHSVRVAYGNQRTSSVNVVKCKFVVGADGARSAVRRAAGIDFEGQPATMTAMLGDVVLASPPASPVLSACNSAGCMLLAPLGDGIHHRIVLIDHQRTGVPQSEAVTLDELAASARRVSGQDFGPHDPIWLSRFGNETRLAATYRKGRILLAGDAAHVHMPAGGQGMNVGLQDAFNLGWKLAAVVRGRAPESLLASYDAERRPVGQRLCHNTLAQTALATAHEPHTLALRDVMNQLLRIPVVNRQLADQLTGFDVAYPGASLAGVPRGWAVDPEITGRRLPDMSLRLAGKDSVISLYSLFHDAQWVELSFRGRGGGDEEQEEAFPGWTKSVDVVELPIQHFRLKQYDAVLVRPDGYTAFVRTSCPAVEKIVEHDMV